MYCAIQTDTPPFSNQFYFTNTENRNLFGLQLSFPDKSTVVINGTCNSYVYIGIMGGEDGSAAGQASWTPEYLRGKYKRFRAITDMSSGGFSLRGKDENNTESDIISRNSPDNSKSFTVGHKLGLRLNNGTYNNVTLSIMASDGTGYKPYEPYGVRLVDITPYIAYQGWKVSRNDIDGQNAGRNLEGTMIRDLIATKRRIDVTIVPLPAEQMSSLLSLLDGEYITVTFDDLQLGRVTKKMYSNNFSWTYCMKGRGDTEYYQGLSFPLIEV